MRSLAKSPLDVARVAFETAQAALPAYSCSKSPKKFTQWQLFSILVLKDFLQQDYRGIVALLKDWTDLREALGLAADKLPNFSTLKYASDRLLKKSPPAPFCAPPSVLPAKSA